MFDDMKKQKPIWYEPHPVSPERKRELVAKGYRIIDAIHAPEKASAEPEAPQREEVAQVRIPVGPAPRKRGRPRKSDSGTSVPSRTGTWA